VTPKASPIEKVLSINMLGLILKKATLEKFFMKNHAWTAILYLSAGLLLGMLIHGWFYRSDPKVSPKEPGSVSLENSQSAADPEDSASQNVDLSSSKQLVEALFPGARIGGGEKKHRSIPLPSKFAASSATPSPATRKWPPS